MGATLAIVLPIFGLVTIGYAAVRTRYVSQQSADGLNAFVLSIATPVLLFRTLSTARFGDFNPFLFWASYFSGTALVFAAAIAVGRHVGGLDRRSSVIAGVAAAYSNLVLVSLPVVERVYGRAGLDAIALLIAVHLPVMIVASMLLVEWAAARDLRAGAAGAAGSGYRTALKRLARSLSTHPLVLGVAAGLAFRASGLSLPEPGVDLVDAIARTAGPLALIALGMSLPRYRIGGELRLPLILGALALLAQPAAVYLIGSMLLPPLWLGVAVLGAAAPSGVNAYLLAVHFRSGERLAATVTVWTTFASLATLTLWVAILGF